MGDSEITQSIKDLIEQLDVGGGGSYRGERSGYHVFDITDEGMDRWLKIKEIGDHKYEVIYEDECKHSTKSELTLSEIVDEYVITP